LPSTVSVLRALKLSRERGARDVTAVSPSACEKASCEYAGD
jgi:hypothetical protein